MFNSRYVSDTEAYMLKKLTYILHKTTILLVVPNLYFINIYAEKIAYMLHKTTYMCINDHYISLPFEGVWYVPSIVVLCVCSYLSCSMFESQVCTFFQSCHQHICSKGNIYVLAYMLYM